VSQILGSNEAEMHEKAGALTEIVQLAGGCWHTYFTEVREMA
jgi:hypothetical protein